MTQLYAKIKNSSRYRSQQSYHVDDKGKHIPFPVEIPNIKNLHEGEVKGGVGGNYHFSDVNIYVKVDGNFKRIK